MTIAELRGVTKRYGPRTALDNVTLQVQEGEVLALLGPNGSGKTTLLKILAFLLKPDVGKVYFQGELANEENSGRIRLQSALVFQRTILFSTTVFNNVAYGLKIRKTPKNEINEEVKRVLKLVKLEGFDKRPAKKLSGGEQQRVALARTLILKTKLLLLDEPTANLDPKNASLLEDAVLKVNRELGTTVVMATHNMEKARTLPNRIALMNDGKLIETGLPQSIFGKLSKNLASFAEVDNTFTGEAQITPQGTTIVDIGNGVKIEMALQIRGDVHVFVSPQDIILSKKSLESSARNILRGRIVRIANSNGLVKLTIDVGRSFAVQITKRSFDELKLNLDSEVFLTFKASSVHPV